MSCDAELQELMIQVDRLVEEKKLEWQEKIKNTESQLNITLQENFNLKSIIDEKNNEIVSFKNRIKYSDNMSNIFDYDQQVLELRLELSQIKKSYEKYYHKYTKKTKEIEKEKDELCKEKIDLLKEINELRSLQRNFNDERTQYQAQIKEFELKQITYLNERTTFNEQIKLMKKDFNDQLNVYVEAEKTYSHNLKELESKLSNSKTSFQYEIDETKTKLVEVLQQMKKAMEEKQQLIIDNDSAKRMIIRLENELSRLSSEIKIKEKTICKMEQVIKVSEKTINEKNEVIRALQVNSASKDYVSTVSKLENDLLDAKSYMKSCKKNEKSYQVEIQSLQKKLKDTQSILENETIRKEELEVNLKQRTILENEKFDFNEKIKNLECVIDSKSVEIANLKSKLENIELINEELIQRSNKEQLNNNDNITRTNSRKKSEDEYLLQSTESLMKERNYLLKFCEDKDLIIHRLQMENRILQDFISKLNNGLSDEASFYNNDLIGDNGLSMFDSFHPLKETFTDFDSSVINPDKPLETNNQNIEISSKSSTSKYGRDFVTNSSDSFSNINFYHSHESFPDNINKSSGEFLTRLIQSADTGDQMKTNENESFMQNIYPTLAAAKYFTDEREKTREIEKKIDFHMNQLKKTTENRRSMSNQ